MGTMPTFLLLLLFLLAADVSQAGRRRSKVSGDGLKNSNNSNNATAEADKDGVAAGRRREGRVFSLFNIVTFEQGPCASNSVISGDMRRNGTCMTSTECQDNSGQASGNCAAGFGVCCLHIISATGGGTVTQNCTYIQNPGFPSTLSDTNAIQYTIRRCNDDVCDLRLDFETFTTVANAVTTELNGGACADMFTVTAPASNLAVPPICGQNTGQHIYVDIGNQSGDTATLNFAFTGTSNARTWEIKVTQVECTAKLQPPDGCLQYHDGLTGRFTTFNWIPTSGTTHLANQDYSVCIRQQEGFCCVQYQVCNAINPFSLDTDIVIATGTKALQDSRCSMDYIIIEDSSGVFCDQGNGNQAVVDRYCGPILSPMLFGEVSVPVCDCSQPFAVGIRTDAVADPDGAAIANTNAAILSRGLCLMYMQIPCT